MIKYVKYKQNKEVIESSKIIWQYSDNLSNQLSKNKVIQVSCTICGKKRSQDFVAC